MSTKDRKLLEKENRRESILSAAETVMSTHGIHGLSIDLIANETQLAKGTIYLYFKSKEEIMAQLTLKARLLLLKEFRTIEQNDENGLEKVKSIVKANYLFFKKHPLSYDLFSFYEANNRFVETEELYKASEDIAKVVIGITEKAQKEGFINPNLDPDSFTWCLYGMTVGVLQLAKVRGESIKEHMDISEESILNTYLKVLEFGIVNK